MIIEETLPINYADLHADTNIDKIESFRNRAANLNSNLKLTVKQRGETANRLKVDEQQEDDVSISEINADDTEHMRSYKKIIQFFGFLGFFFGFGEIRYGWKFHHRPAFWITNFYLTFSLFSVGYTVYGHYSNGDYMKMIEPFAVIGVALSCWMKWYCHCTFWEQMISLYFAPKKLCQQNLIGVRADIINTGLKRTCTVIKTYTIGVIVNLSLFVAVPITLFLVDGTRMPLLPIEIIFFDGDTSSDFIASSIMHVQLGLYSSLATIMFGSGFLISICNYSFLTNLIQQDFKDLDEMWNVSSTTSIAYRHAFLVNICKKLQDMKRYIEKVKGVFELNFFIYFLTNYLGQIICLYQIKKNNWIPGYSFAVICFIEMFFYCIIGTQITIEDDKMCHIIHNTNWYTFDIHSQKIILQMLNERQRPNNLQLKSLGTLNVITGIQVVKGIYTYYTVLSELL